jgi:ribonucleotide monophosphatase NagD (HAD superfamily)
MVGDRLDTDIAAGNRMGVYTALVLTGVSSQEEAESARSDFKPDRIIGSLSELLET